MIARDYLHNPQNILCLLFWFEYFFFCAHSMKSKNLPANLQLVFERKLYFLVLFVIIVSRANISIFLLRIFLRYESLLFSTFNFVGQKSFHVITCTLPLDIITNLFTWIIRNFWRFFPCVQKIWVGEKSFAYKNFLL